MYFVAKIVVLPVHFRHSARCQPQKETPSDQRFLPLISLYCVVFIALARLAHCYKMKL